MNRLVWLHDLCLYMRPSGDGARIFIGSFMLVTGVLRVLTGHSLANINVLPARVYGALLIVGAAWLLLTAQDCWRNAWGGRLAATFCAALWLLVIANAWSTHAWVSISGGIVFVLFLGNEVRIRER